jgi:hypothetical protein
MILTVTGADFSALGLGSADWVLSWCAKVGITDPTKKVAYQNFRDSLVNAGIFDLLDAILTFPEDTQAKQSFLFSPLDTPPKLTFAGTPLFAADGFNPNGAGVAILPTLFPAGNLTAASFGAWNSTSEVVASGSKNRYSIFYNGLNTGGVDDLGFGMTRNYSATSQITNASHHQVAGPQGNVNPAGYDLTKIGFLQYVRTPTTAYLIDNGVQVGTASNTTIPTGGGTGSLVRVGGDSGVNGYSASKYTFAYLGRLSLAQSITFHGIVKTFLTATGR